MVEACDFANIGIVKADNCGKPNQGWWDKGYYYYQTGTIYDFTHETKEYGEEIKENDVMEICLDLKDKNELSFIVNDKDLGKIPFDIKTDISYRLAIGFYQKGKIDLVSCEIVES